MVIAIDGPAGAGKSTVARAVAKELGFIYLDTGSIYRAITLKALEKNLNFKDEASLVQMCRDTELNISNDNNGAIKVLLDGVDVTGRIRSPHITQHVSDVAKVKGVRTQMLELQRSIGLANSSVIDGRDIGTVVFPDADRKFYLDAEFNERVKRRFEELEAAGNRIAKVDVEEDLKKRDHIDSTRSCAPLRQAEDAVYIDTTNMTVEEVVSKILSYVR